MKTQTSLLLSLLATLAAILPTGCGQSENDAPASAPPAPAAPSVALAPGERLVEITGDDQMKYNITEIRAKAGEKLVVSLKNIGKIPKPAMAHNWVLLKAMDEAAIGALATAAVSRPPEFLPTDMSAVLAHTKMVGAGETDVVKVTVPSAPGTYPYICTFPGHFMLMRGKLIVE